MSEPLTDEKFEKIIKMRKGFNMPTVEEFDSLIATVESLKEENAKLKDRWEDRYRGRLAE